MQKTINMLITSKLIMSVLRRPFQLGGGKAGHFVVSTLSCSV